MIPPKLDYCDFIWNNLAPTYGLENPLFTIYDTYINVCFQKFLRTAIVSLVILRLPVEMAHWAECLLFSRHLLAVAKML